MHVVHVASGTPVTLILRTAKTPAGGEVATVIKHVTRRLRKSPRWKRTHIVWRHAEGVLSARCDSHYGRPEAMEWAETNSCGYIFGLAGNSVLSEHCNEAVEVLRLKHAASASEKLRGYVSFDYRAKSWSKPRRVVARIEASMQRKDDGFVQEIDIRCIVTSLAGDPQHLYENVYCQRGQAENLIKLSKTQLASRRTSCHSATANQVRLVLATAAFWIMHTLKSAIPKAAALAKAEFQTIRLRLLKIAARVVEHGHRIRVHLPASCPEASLFAAVASGLMPRAP
jgi:hypothetical protein